MNLKKLAALVCVAQATQMAFTVYQALSRHYLTFGLVFQISLSIPTVLFFFYVWKRQKS
jgi:uncharacterized membrane protein